MKAIDVMVRDVVTATPDTPISEAAKLLVDHDISALPVIDADGRIVGILSEADLIHREEIGTEKRHSRWIEAILPAHTLAADYAEAHAKTVGEVMTTEVVFAPEDASLGEIATLLERHRIKRVPITRDGKLVGVVSRSNLVQALAAHGANVVVNDADRAIRLELLDRLGKQSWTDFGERNVTVENGKVHLWGLVSSDDERKALIVLAETTPGVREVIDEMIPSAGW